MMYLRLLSVVIAVAFFTACTTSPILVDEAVDSVGNKKVQDNFIVGLDRKFLEINSRIPGFAGVYFNDRQKLVVNLADRNLNSTSEEELDKRKSEILNALVVVLGENSLIPGVRERDDKKTERIAKLEGDIILRQVKYSFEDLAKWRLNVDRLLASPDVVSTDVDERRNRVAIGVVSSEIERELSEALKSMEIPKDAYVIVEKRRDKQNKSLRSDFNPPPGGVQIEIDTALLGFSTCTLGFNANLGSRVGFVTNDHCGKNSGEVNNDSVHQPTDSINPFSFDRIGIEHVDPAPFTGGSCSPNMECRYSDSMFVRYTTSQGDDIAEADSWNSGSLDLAVANDRLVVTDIVPSILSGTVLDKVGRTTGWTYGEVGETCGHSTPVDSTIRRLCQSYVYRISGRNHDMVDSGDSGSPVFRWTPGNAQIAGLLWGGPVDPPQDYFVFSPLEGVRADLGGSLRPSDVYVPPIVSTPCGPASPQCCEVDIINFKPVCISCASQFGMCPIDSTPLLEKLFDG